MISFEVNVSGEQLGRQLASDPEECAYALKSMAAEKDGNFALEVGEYLSGDDDLAQSVATALQQLLDLVDQIG